MVTGLCLNFAFIIVNGKDVSNLYVPSIVILCVSMIFNFTATIIILMKEITKYDNFQIWFQKYTKPAAIFTTISTSDVEAIYFLSSSFGGLEFLKAPFSDDAKWKIFWCSFINLFIKDIPQLVIQVIYFKSIIQYNIIPFLSLVSSLILIFINLIGRVYQGVIYFCLSPNNTEYTLPTDTVEDETEENK